MLCEYLCDEKLCLQKFLTYKKYANALYKWAFVIDDFQQQYARRIYKKMTKFNHEEISFVLKHQYSKEHTVKR